MMKTRIHEGYLLAIAAAVALALPAGAARDEARIDAMMVPSNSIHTGAASYSDQQIASDLVSAISSDRLLSGAAITVVVTDGLITLSGSAKDAAQAARAEQLANDIAGGRPVTGKLDVQGG